jgi:hypothetical protein
MSVVLSRSKSDIDQRFLRAIYGIAFFGVPHDGLDIRSLIPMVRDGPNRFLLESIGHNSSQVLSTLQREFPMALGGEGESEIVCFYETAQSSTPQEVCLISLYQRPQANAHQDDDGNWAMGGPEAAPLTKSSATHCRSWENGPEHICAINRTHSNLVKFSLHDEEYDKVLQRVNGLAQRSLTARKRIRDSGVKCT